MVETESARPRLLALTFVALFGAAAAVSVGLAARSGLTLFRALAGLNLWAVVVALVHALPRWPWRLRPLLAALAGVAPAAWLWWPRPGTFAGVTDATLQLATVAAALLAFGLHFLATYGTHVGRVKPEPALATLVPLSRLLAAAQVLVGLVLLAYLYAQRVWFTAVHGILVAVTVTLVAEALLQSLLRSFQPRRLRAGLPAFGASVLLPTLFGEAGPWRSLTTALEKQFGLRFADTWLVRLARQLAAPLGLFGLLGLWASTAVTHVPLSSRGVLVERGEFQTPALAPGLHWHAPWPWARVAVVPTERVQEMALGFERDLAGPVLWAEKHFEGEQNLLLGGGEELLTVNVPVHYRIRDAVAFLRRTADPAQALDSLGYRQLLTLTEQHSAFGLMTTDRAEIATQLRTNLQAAVDRLGLGLEIVFVGLKDVHPPVAVAPAYQDVISAEEERSALVHQAHTYTVLTLGSAQVAAHLARIQAEATGRERRTRAAGESSRFLAPLATYRLQPEVFTTRLRLEALETALAGVRQLYVVPPPGPTRRAFIVGADGATNAAVLPR